MLACEGACLLRSVIRVEHIALNRFSMYSVSSSDLGSRFLYGATACTHQRCNQPQPNVHKL